MEASIKKLDEIQSETESEHQKRWMDIQSDYAQYREKIMQQLDQFFEELSDLQEQKYDKAKKLIQNSCSEIQVTTDQSYAQANFRLDQLMQKTEDLERQMKDSLQKQKQLIDESFEQTDKQFEQMKKDAEEQKSDNDSWHNQYQKIQKEQAKKISVSLGLNAVALTVILYLLIGR